MKSVFEFCTGCCYTYDYTNSEAFVGGRYYKRLYTYVLPRIRIFGVPPSQSFIGPQRPGIGALRIYRYIKKDHIFRFMCNITSLVADNPELISLNIGFGLFSIETSPINAGNIQEYKDEKWIILPLIPLSFTPFINKKTPLKSKTKIIRKRAPKGFVYNYKGTLILKKNSIKISTKWYEKEVDAVFIDNHWTPLTNDIAKDFRTNTWGWKNTMTSGIVDYNKETRKVTMGYFSLETGPNAKSTVMVVINESSYIAINEDYALKLGFIEELDGNFILKEYETAYEPTKLRNMQNALYFEHIKKKIISSSKIGDDLNKKIKLHNIKYGTDSCTNLISENKPYTFGVEIETSNGRLVPHVYTNKLNLRATRDGSCAGAEYITGALFGDSGFTQLRNICTELKKRCKSDTHCGVHVHLGNINLTKEVNIYLYLLCNMLQEELFKLFPSHRRTNRYCSPLDYKRWLVAGELRNLFVNKDNKKDYRTILHKIYSSFFMHLSNGKPLSQTFNRNNPHPQGHYAGGHGAARYNWLNLIVANFKQRTETMESTDIDDMHDINFTRNPSISRRNALYEIVIGRSDKRKTNKKVKINLFKFFTAEFRLHSDTLEYIKIRNWILICMGIISFVESNQSQLIEALQNNTILKLSTVLRAVYSEKKSSMLIDYIEKRKQLFLNPDHTKDDLVFTMDLRSPVNSGTLAVVKETNN